MDFKDATDILFEHVRQEEFAEELGISLASVRQARLSPYAKAYRTPPKNWEKAVVKLARKHGKELLGLADKLEN